MEEDEPTIYLSISTNKSKQQTDESGTLWNVKREVCIDGPEKHEKLFIHIGDGNPYSHTHNNLSDTERPIQ